MLFVASQWPTGLLAQAFNYLPTANGQLLHKSYYSVSYIEAHEQPEWVAYKLDRQMLRKVVNRRDNFRADPMVLEGSATYEDYLADARYDAGHLLPSRQMQFSCRAMDETFFMSNMSPQEAAFNRYKWALLEKLERNMAYRNGTIYCVSGPVLTNIRERIGPNQVSVPDAYYKIILCHNDSITKVIAFLLPNRKEETPFEAYVVPVDSVEAITGIDFFPALANELEHRIEAVTDVSQWSFKNPNTNFGYAEAATTCTPAIIAAEAPPEPELPREPKPQPQEGGKININTANVQTLMKLPGIGEAKARAIIEARPFATIEGITRVKGIGQGTFNKFAQQITTGN